MYPMRDFTASGSSTTSIPATRAEPDVSWRRPQRIRMVVVFPEPLGPRMPKISPGRMSKETSSTAVIFPNRRTRERTSTTGADSAPGYDSGIGRQSGLQVSVLRVDRHLDPEHDVRPLLFGERRAGGELGARRDLDHVACEPPAISEDGHLDLVAQPHAHHLGRRD